MRRALEPAWPEKRQIVRLWSPVESKCVVSVGYLENLEIIISPRREQRNTGENLLTLLESRLDNVVWMGLEALELSQTANDIIRSW